MAAFNLSALAGGDILSFAPQTRMVGALIPRTSSSVRPPRPLSPATCMLSIVCAERSRWKCEIGAIARRTLEKKSVLLTPGPSDQEPQEQFGRRHQRGYVPGGDIVPSTSLSSIVGCALPM